VSPLKKALVALYCSYAARYLISFLSLPFLARALGPMGLGDLAIIDVYELLVLKGGERVLRHFKWAKVEAADFEAYEGCATVRSLTEYLSRGFRLKRKDKFATRRGGGAYFDLLFVRQT
jgi:hypothetical protein